MLLNFVNYCLAGLSDLAPLDSRLGLSTAFVAGWVASCLFWPWVKHGVRLASQFLWRWAKHGVCVTSWLLRRWGKRGAKLTVHRFDDPATCRIILRNQPYDASLGRNILSKEFSRAFPNQRLVRAFQIDNGFTTNDPDHGKLFKEEAVRQLRLCLITTPTGGGWSQIATTAHNIASAFFRNSTSNGRADLDLIVQAVTLKVVLSAFFDVDPATCTDNTASEIARLINLLWIQSKSETGSHSADFDLLKNLLHEIGLDWNDNKENPLNILLPAYETLWRVVARCLVEVVFRPSADPEWLRNLKEYRLDPCNVTFATIRNGYRDCVTVEWIVKEALRLYPPTRRIYRYVHLEKQEDAELIALDIEQCHRLPHIWGDNSHRFWPARWDGSGDDKSMGNAWMPFGAEPWICPASSGFGTRMIGLLVAVLASILSAKDWELRLSGEGPDGGSQILDDEMKLDSDRREGTAWEIVKKTSQEDMEEH
ncbi:MAG: hypothetical protein Q9221_003315 [Calogaya cf. arnoldii]